MNILLIGNGFDLAHHLPTSYNDFLNFLGRIFSNSKNPPPLRLTELENSINATENLEIIKNIKKLYNTNIWYIHFLRQKNISSNWCDFESEIEYVTNNLQNIKKSFQRERIIDSNKIDSPIKRFIDLAVQDYLFEIWMEEYSKIEGFKWPRSPSEMPTNIQFTIGLSRSIDKFNIATNIHKNSKVIIAYEGLIKFIIDQLNEFTKCFELYLTIFVNKLNIPKIKFIDDILKTPNINIISFNYTNTISKYITISDNNISFIHGKATDNEHNNLVLGIDEQEDQSDPLFMRFKKYFQRYEKSCSIKYYEWIKEINYQHSVFNPPTHKLLIIGHSLTLSDREILYKLITLNEMHTSIYYHSEESKIELMQNLAAILGQENFTNLTLNEKICFIPGAFNEIEN